MPGALVGVGLLVLFQAAPGGVMAALEIVASGISCLPGALVEAAAGVFSSECGPHPASAMETKASPARIEVFLFMVLGDGLMRLLCHQSVGGWKRVIVLEKCFLTGGGGVAPAKPPRIRESIILPPGSLQCGLQFFRVQHQVGKWRVGH